MNGQIKLITCGRCQQEVVYINFFSDYLGIIGTISWRCLICHELDKFDAKQNSQINNKNLTPPFPENWEKLKKIKEKRLNYIESLIEELNEQKEAIKQNKI